MTQHVTLLDEGFATVGTGVRPFARVRPTVRHQVPFAHEVFRAQVATERPFSIGSLVMGSLVKQQVALERERLAALGARERSLARMAAHMIDQVLFTRKRFRTNIATVRRFARMLTQMIC